MSEELSVQDVYDLHLKEFGVEPVITGINYNQSDKILEMILMAVIKGIPYIEQDVPEGVMT